MQPVVIIRTENAGVHYGELYSMDDTTRKAVLKNARRLWYWSGAASLSQLALEGVKKQRDCRFTVALPEITVYEVIEIIPCSEQATKVINEVPEWKI